MAASFREQRYNRLFKFLREDIYNLLCKIRAEEDIKGQSCRQLDIHRYYALLIYLMIIYNDITNPFSDVLTWDEYKEKYTFEDVAKAVACKEINLYYLVNQFNFQELIDADGVDSQPLIDALPNIESINTIC